MAEQLCRFCDNPAVGRCEECGRFYCAEHGDVVCATCGDPSRGVPGAVLFRGTLLALAVGVVVAVFLIVSPPENDSDDGGVPAGDATDEPAATATGTSTAEVTDTPAEGETSTPVTPTETGPAETPATTATPAGQTYTVQFGDTLSGIADQFGVTLDELVAANNIADPNNVEPGTVLVIP
jgi:LysM repeat protein